MCIRDRALVHHSSRYNIAVSLKPIGCFWRGERRLMSLSQVLNAQTATGFVHFPRRSCERRSEGAREGLRDHAHRDRRGRISHHATSHLATAPLEAARKVTRIGCQNRHFSPQKRNRISFGPDSPRAHAPRHEAHAQPNPPPGQGRGLGAHPGTPRPPPGRRPAPRGAPSSPQTGPNRPPDAQFVIARAPPRFSGPPGTPNWPGARAPAVWGPPGPPPEKNADIGSPNREFDVIRERI